MIGREHRLDSQTVGYVARTVEYLYDTPTNETAKLTALSGPRKQFDAAVSGGAFRTGDVALSHDTRHS
jgi:hypothetical protein